MDDLDFWHDAWASGIVSPSVRQPDNTLEMHWPSLEVAPGSRVLVPMSGKSGDLIWLASHGYVPVGVEISPIPCRDFFAELGILPDQTTCGPFVQWLGSGVTLLQGNFFDLKATYDAAVDRGALVAVSPSRRVSYAEHLKARMTPGAPILLVVLRIPSSRTKYDDCSRAPSNLGEAACGAGVGSASAGPRRWFGG
jgi:thiopurine S-methyltransferase